jgi:DNA transformation protein and related proteins
MAKRDEFVMHVLDLLAPLGDVHSRAMFGGHGVYCGELFFALIAKNELFFKVDDTNRAEFEAEGLTPFTYQKQGKSQSMSYYRAPADAVDDSDVMLVWAKKGFAAAQRAAAAKAR